MNKRLTLLLLSIGLAAGAYAQDPTSPVTTSTDPARAAAAEKTAGDIKDRKLQDTMAGKPAVSASVVRGQTTGGLDYLSGGVTVGDRVKMKAERTAYSLWVTTVAKPSGAYMSDAQLRIVDLKDQSTVVDRKMDGPWFMVALPAGRYQVQATLRADGAAAPQTISSPVQIATNGQRQTVLRFDSRAQVDPDRESPLKGNPFGKPQAAK